VTLFTCDETNPELCDFPICQPTISLESRTAIQTELETLPRPWQGGKEVLVERAFAPPHPRTGRQALPVDCNHPSPRTGPGNAGSCPCWDPTRDTCCAPRALRGPCSLSLAVGVSVAATVAIGSFDARRNGRVCKLSTVASIVCRDGRDGGRDHVENCNYTVCPRHCWPGSCSPKETGRSISPRIIAIRDSPKHRTDSVESPHRDND